MLVAAKRDRYGTARPDAAPLITVDRAAKEATNDQEVTPAFESITRTITTTSMLLRHLCSTVVRPQLSNSPRWLGSHTPIRWSSKKSPTPQPESNITHDHELAQALEVLQVFRGQKSINKSKSVEVNPTPQTASNSTHDIGHAQALEAADKTEDNLSIESKAKEVNPTSRPASNITHDNELAQALEAPDETEDNSSIESKTEKPNPTSQPLSSITDDQEFTRTYHPLEWLEDNPSHKLAGKVRTLPNPELKYSNNIPDPRIHSTYVIGGLVPKATRKRVEDNEIPGWDDSDVYVRYAQEEGKKPVTVALPNFWLRDSCRCRKCVNHDTLQKTFDTFSIPKDIRPLEVTTEKDGLRIIWDGYDKHGSVYPWSFIVQHGKNSTKALNLGETKYWGSEIADNPPSVDYDEIMANDEGVSLWTKKIRTYGFCYVDNCPISPEATKKLLERIAFIRVTHYGGFYDFTSDLTMKDTAYTSLALAAHTDTPYFTDPAGLQMFHLLSHTEGSGGKSLLVDGLHAAEILRSEDNAAFQILRSKPLTWHASGNKGITITAAKPIPMFNTVSNGVNKHVFQIRWNNDDRAVLPLGANFENVTKWYDAARKFDKIIKRKDMEYWAQLEPGRPLIFDNWRVLHGRSAFTGKRRMCGGYINHDDYVSRWRNTNYPRSRTLKQVAELY